MDPNAPAPWLMFVIMFVAVGGAVGLIVLIGGLSRLARGESFWPASEAARPSPARANVRRAWVRRGSGVRAGSEGANAALRHQDGTFAGSAGSRSGSEVRESSPPPPPVTSDLPQNVDELAWALEAVRLRTSGEEPTKEAAIIRAFPHVNSKGGGSWQRASQLYDVVSQAQRQRATAQPPETAVQPTA